MMCAGSEVLTAAVMKSTVFRNIMLCSLLKVKVAFIFRLEEQKKVTSTDRKYPSTPRLAPHETTLQENILPLLRST
jgi:hypothetical protein